MNDPEECPRCGMELDETDQLYDSKEGPVCGHCHNELENED